MMKTAIATSLILAAACGAAYAKMELRTCSANRAYCSAEAKKRGWTRPQCAEAFARCLTTGEWQTSGPFGRTVRNVERR